MTENIDVSEVRALAADLSTMGARVVKPMAEMFDETGDDLRDLWRTNARRTSGKHGKHYPNSITAERKLGTDIIVEVGPDRALRQGSMGRGFEFGSKNQPPHLDGQKAANAIEPKIDRRIAEVLRDAGL